MCRYNSIVSASAPTYHERLEDKYTSKFSSLSPCTLYLSTTQGLWDVGPPWRVASSVCVVTSDLLLAQARVYSIWGLGLGDLCLHSQGPHYASDWSHRGGTEPSKIPPCLHPHLGDPHSSQHLMCQVFKPLSIQSIHANLLNGQTLLKYKSTLSSPYWHASGWQHSTFTLEHTDGELQDVGYWGDGWDRYGSLQNKERLA